jgi:quercetin dioxygenase-like cupin family protein
MVGGRGLQRSRGNRTLTLERWFESRRSPHVPSPSMSTAPRRIVTGHDASGKSVVLSDAPTPKTLDIGTAAFHEIWITDETPARIAASEPEPTDRPVRTPPPTDGVMVRVTEMAPGAESPMHRTETVDVGVVLDGETWLLLDDGSETRVGVGDAVVQRGTNHAWANRSDRPVRMLFVLIDGTISDELRAAAGPLEFFDQTLD